MGAEKRDVFDDVVGGLWVALLFTAQGDLTAVEWLMNTDRGLTPEDLRVAVRAAGGEMVGYPSEDLLADFERLGGSGSAVTIRCPLWTTAGRSPLRLDVEATLVGHSSSYVFLHLVDAQGDPLTPGAAGTVSPAAPEPAPPPVAGADLRVPRGRFVAPRPDLRVLLLAEYVERVVDDWAERLDELDADHRALMVVDRFASAVSGGGLPSPYLDLPIDDLGRRLVEACVLVGAPGFADLFRRIDEALPPEARCSREARQAYLVDRLMTQGDTGWFDAFEDELIALGDGTALLGHLVTHIDANPDLFLR